MTNETPLTPAEMLQRIQDDFRKKLPERFTQLETLYQEVKAGKIQLTEDLRRAAHSLAGAGGTFGMPELSSLAKELEMRLKSGHFPDEKMWRESMEAMRMVTVKNQNTQQKNEAESVIESAGHSPLLSRRVYYYRFGEKTPEWLSQLTNFRIPVTICKSLDELKDIWTASLPPLAVICDLGELTADEVKLSTLMPPPSTQRHTAVIVVSSKPDYFSRLQASRAGVDAYLVNPVFLPDLVETLDRIARPQDGTAYRVLVVDDDVSVSLYHAAVLNSTGMQVKVVHDAKDVDKAIEEFSPELILLDVYMPEWSGPEIARAIRQQSQYISLPIVFLSAEDNRRVQLNIMSHGGDDFLVKPIKPEHLIEAVRIRARRYRELRNTMLSDPLTGTLNRRALLHQLDLELARCRRNQLNLSLALLDVDYFKKVNDTHGHQVGDAVLRSLTQLVRQRLRHSDIIGRFGGEEFVVVLPDTPFKSALSVMEDVRKTFEKLEHVGGVQPFHNTFSAGVVAWGKGMEAHELLEKADQALYRAKQNGRNRIES